MTVKRDSKFLYYFNIQLAKFGRNFVTNGIINQFVLLPCYWFVEKNLSNSTADVPESIVLELISLAALFEALYFALLTRCCSLRMIFSASVSLSFLACL